MSAVASTPVTTLAVDGQVLSREGGANVWASPETRQAALVRAQGLISETGPRSQYTSTGLAIDGTEYLLALGVLKGDVISNIHLAVTAAAAVGATTRAKIGLKDAAGNLLASSADLGNAWESTGTKTHALSGPYTVLTSGGLYVCVLGKNPTTMPTFLRASNVTNAAQAVGSNLRSFCTGGTGLTDLPNPSTPQTGAPLAFWAGVS